LALNDSAALVRAIAADVLRHHRDDAQLLPTLVAAMSDDNEWVRLLAANAIQRLGERARPALDTARRATKDKNAYVVRVANRILAQLGEAPATSPAP
jgi:HEAT repeat protein